MGGAELPRLARLLRASHRTVLYLDSRQLGGSEPGTASQPGRVHRLLVRLEEVGLVHTAVALDPFSLLQKAGFPQVTWPRC